MIEAGSRLGLAGETKAARAVFQRVVDAAPPGKRRAEALARLAWNSEDDFVTSLRLLEEARTQAGDEPVLNATIHLYLSDYRLVVGDRDCSSAEAHRALDYAERCDDPALLAAVLAQLFYTDWALGRGADETALRRALELERDLEVVGLRLMGQLTRQPVQIGRTLVALGAVQRRQKQRRTARDTLELALALFEEAQAALWTERARQELARIGGRTTNSSELTTTELRVAELIAGGMSNKAAAAELFVTRRTIESTLTKVYAKLGISSRTQLASQLRAR